MFVHCVCGARRCCVLEPWAHNQEQRPKVFEGKTVLLNRIAKFKLKSKKKAGYGMKPKKSGTKGSSTISGTSEIVCLES